MAGPMLHRALLCFTWRAWPLRGMATSVIVVLVFSPTFTAGA